MARKIRKGRNEAVVFEKVEVAPEQTVIEAQPELDDAIITSKPPTAKKRANKGAQDAPEAEVVQDAERAPSAAHGPTLGDVCERWLRHLEEIGKSRGTVFGYSLDVGIAIKHFGADASVASLTPRKVQAYFDAPAVTQTKSGRAKAKPTIDKTRRAFRLALTWAHEAGLIAESPIPEVKS